MDLFAIFIGKTISWVSKRLNLGAGATWPGEMALRISPRILSKLLLLPKEGIIIIAGTNGKTTTASMIVHLLKHKGKTVIRNESGANLVNGIVSSLLSASGPVDFAVFEVDENALPLLLTEEVIIENKIPVTIILLNLFRDQLDRYGEVDAIADHWRSSLSHVDGRVHVILNADDPQIAYIGSGVEVQKVYFGLGDKKYYLSNIQHATDSIYCPSCGKRLVFDGVYFSHLGQWRCNVCGFTHPKLHLTSHDVISPLEGVYNVYNTLAATAVGIGNGLNLQECRNILSTFIPAFGRMEEIIYQGKKVKILLSKNPTGFNESIRTVLSSKQKGPLMVLLNDRIPDGRDVSWIWDVDFENLSAYDYPIIISGDRALDMGLRLKYSSKSQITNNKSQKIIVDLKEALQYSSQQTKPNETVWILATYSAMLDVRKILTGRKIL